MTEIPTIQLKIDRRTSHPWIFQKMIQKPSQRLKPGTVVDIVERSGKWVGRGFYNGHSRIALRVLTTSENEPIDDDFFANRLQQAIDLRRKQLHLDETTDAYRLVHSEGDGLSGIVVDRFGSVIVLEYFAAGMFRFRDAIVRILSEHFPDSRFYWFAEQHIQKQESFDCWSVEPPPPSAIRENGVRFRVHPGSKHKTGFFLDQRDNRRFLAEMCEGQRVLDLCCNSGGFAVYAMTLGKAKEAVAVDLDEDALAMAKQNADLNQVRVRFVQADIFTWLRDVLPNGEQFDVVVLDPTKQTRDREAVGYALKRYYDMNRLAIQAVKPGGVLLTCSCTGLVKEVDFLESLRRASWQENRQLQVMRVAGAGADHPYFVHVPEGRYLKAVFCRVV